MWQLSTFGSPGLFEHLNLQSYALTSYKLMEKAFKAQVLTLLPAALITLAWQLGKRLSHILRRLLSIAQFLVERDGSTGLNGHYAFQQRVGKAYHTFIDEVRLS